MTSEDLVFNFKFKAAVEDVWAHWIQPKKIEKWLTPIANIDPKVGGAYELFWDPKNREENSTLGCQILTLIPNRLLEFQWRGPIAYASIMNVKPFPTAVSVTFEAASLNETFLQFRHKGWGTTETWNFAKSWQKNAWQTAFQQLEKLIQSK